MLTISIVDLYTDIGDDEDNGLSSDDISLIIQLESIANEYNKLDMRHLVKVVWHEDDDCPVISVSTQVALTPEFGDKMTIKKACDELIEYSSEIISNGFANIVPEPESFDRNFLLPEGNFYNERIPYFKGEKNALEHWFGLHSKALFGEGDVQESDTEIVRSLPITWTEQGDATEDILPVCVLFS